MVPMMKKVPVFLTFGGKEQISYRCEEADDGYVGDCPHDGKTSDASYYEEN